jgi:hypothetical protein
MPSMFTPEDHAELATVVKSYTRNGKTVRSHTRKGGGKPKPNHGVGGTTSKKQSPDTVNVGGGKDTSKPTRPGGASGKTKSYKINQTYTSGDAKGRVAVTEKRTQAKGGTKVQQFDFQGKIVAEWFKDAKTGKVVGKKTFGPNAGAKKPRDLKAEREAAKKRVDGRNAKAANKKISEGRVKVSGRD